MVSRGSRNIAEVMPLGMSVDNNGYTHGGSFLKPSTSHCLIAGIKVSLCLTNCLMPSHQQFTAIFRYRMMSSIGKYPIFSGKQLTASSTISAYFSPYSATNSFLLFKCNSSPTDKARDCLGIKPFKEDRICSRVISKPLLFNFAINKPPNVYLHFKN